MVVPAGHASHIHNKMSKPFKNLKVWEIITFGENSLHVFFIGLDL